MRLPMTNNRDGGAARTPGLLVQKRGMILDGHIQFALNRRMCPDFSRGYGSWSARRSSDLPTARLV